MDREILKNMWRGRYVENYPDEMLALANVVESIEPKIIIEIGVKQCGTMRLWESLVPPGGTVIGMDMTPEAQIRSASGVSTETPKILPGHGDEVGDWSWVKCPSSFVDWQTCVIDKFDPALSDRNIHFVIGDSNSPEAHQGVADVLQGRKADFIFHDGGHFDDVPQRDFDNIVNPFLRPGGLFCLADLDCDGVKALLTNLPQGSRELSLINPRRAGFVLWWKP